MSASVTSLGPVRSGAKETPEPLSSGVRQCGAGNRRKPLARFKQSGLGAVSGRLESALPYAPPSPLSTRRPSHRAARRTPARWSRERRCKSVFGAEWRN